MKFSDIISNLETPIKGILFDLDGTLLNSESMATVIVHQFLQEQGVSITLEAVDNWARGKSWKEIGYWTSEEYLNHLSGEELTHLYEEKWSQVDMKEIEVYPQAIEFFQYCQQNFQVGIVSNSKRDFIYSFLKEKLPNNMPPDELVIGEDILKVAKPDPEGYLRAKNTMKLNASEVIVFEDSIPGLTAARAAGLIPIFINHDKIDSPQAYELSEFSVTGYTGLL